MKLRSAAVVAVAVTLGVGLGVGASGLASATPNHAAAHQRALHPNDVGPYSPAEASDVYTPITPCRIVDTRTNGGALAAHATRTYQITGTSRCPIPARATAVIASITALDETGSGVVRTYPTGAAHTGVGNVVSYSKAVQVTGSTTAALSSAGKLDVVAGSASTQLVIDVTGYEQQQIEADVEFDGTLYSGTNRIVSTYHGSTGDYTVVTDDYVGDCSATATASNYGAIATTRLDTDFVSVHITDVNGNDEASGFSLTITC